MPRIRHGRSPWLETLPRSKRPTHPRLTGAHEAQVAIVGGGLTGVMAAYACAAAGLRPMLLESDRLASGATQASPGLVLAEPGSTSFVALEAVHGRRIARSLWQGARRGALECQAAVRRLDIRCDLTPCDGLTLARTEGEARGLRRERAARRAAGLDATWLTPRALGRMGIAGAGALRTRGHAHLDPVRACDGFARAALARGASVFEGTPVTRVRSATGGLEIVTPKGQLLVQSLVVATGEPTRVFRPLARHLTPLETYVVVTPPLPAPVREVMTDRTLLVQDLQDPPHRLHWLDDRIVWSGADGPRTPEKGRERVLVQRTGQLMYELSLLLEPISGIQPLFGWHAPFARTSDGLPLVGPHRNYPRHLFALGGGLNVSHAFLASRILLRHLTGALERDVEAFGFGRLLR